MLKFISLSCSHCHSVMLNLPVEEVRKLNGLTFRCECCSYENHLVDMKFIKVKPLNQNVSIDNYVHDSVSNAI